MKTIQGSKLHDKFLTTGTYTSKLVTNY